MERLEYTPENPDEEPEMKLSFPSGEFSATRFNTSLFTFLGRSAFNHIFITREVQDGVNAGTYIFSHANPYQEMVEYMEAYGYPMHLNQTSVPVCDQQAYEGSLLHDLEEADGIPSDWL